MDTNTKNQNTNILDGKIKNSKLTTLGAWMIVVGLVLAGFSINTYFKNNKPVRGNNDLSPSKNTDDIENIKSIVLPNNGYEINASWGNVGPSLIAAGAIDKEKFISLYEPNGGLNAEQLAILELASDTKIKITSENSHFVLNMLWAFGLAQQNSLLTDGDMVKYGDYARFASTGGWTISSKPLGEFYSKFNWLNLNPEQENKIKNIAENVYRPCCNNSTAFPDCNHGMAALGLIEIMVASGNTEKEIFDALKYFNSFWFSSNYLETAIYFKNIKNTDWRDADSKEILSREYSSSSGWSQNIHGILEQYPDLLPKTENGGGCGV